MLRLRGGVSSVGGTRHRSLYVILALSLVACLEIGTTVAPVPMSGVRVARAASTPVNPNLFDPTSQSKSVKHLPPTTAPTYTPTTPNPSVPTPMGCQVAAYSMQPATIGLNPSGPSHFDSKDGRLTIDVPAGALSSAQVTSDGGAASLRVREILPPSGSNAGGSGHYSFGTYLIQVVDASGHLASHGLAQPATLALHYGTADSALSVGSAYAVVNGSIPPCVSIDPSSSPSANSSALLASVGPLSSAAVTLDAANRTLTSSAPLASPSTSISWGTNSPVATFGKPAPFEADLSGASLTAVYKLDLPPGPKGFIPPVDLVYNSAGVSDQHNPQGAAPWVGEGWNMTMGAISWSEENENSKGRTPVWQDTWELSDPYGTSAQLIPPSTSTAIWYEDSGNSIAPSPIQWHTAPESYAKVFSYVSSLTLPGTATHPPCFRVLLTNGLIEEFGCTIDSVQYYPEPSGVNAGRPYISSWFLDLIIEPDGNQVHITYVRDMETASGMSYPRDTVLGDVYYDSPTCYNANTACTYNGGPGNLWHAQEQVNFFSSSSVAHGSGCPARGTLRCDDPLDLSGSGGEGAPLVQSDQVLNHADVWILNGTTWNVLRTYQFSYEQSAPTTITDPVTGLPESTAGKLNLTQIQVLGDDGSTSLPVTNFTYAQQTEYYEDSLVFPRPSTNCGPVWNTGYTPNHGACVLWSQSYAGNSYYLQLVTNGLGLAQFFAWFDARNNTHGVNNVDPPYNMPYDPYACTYQQSQSVGNTYPCDMADEHAWSRISLGQINNQLERLSQNGQGGAQTQINIIRSTSFTYTNAYPLSAQECSDCVAGYSWGSSDDNDYLDFYNGRFMGFPQVIVSNPDGSAETHKFYSTEGWGVWSTSQVTVTCFPELCHNDPYWDVANQSSYPGQANALHGHEYELDRYDTNGSTLLEQVLTQYTAVCPLPWMANGSPAVSGYGNWNGNLVSELDLENPVVTCDVQTAQSDDRTYDGSTSSSVPDHTTTYTYETGTRPCATCFGRLTKLTTSSNDGSANGSPTTIATATAYVWNDSVTTSSTSASGPYLVTFPASIDTEDTNGNRYQCSFNSYDGQAYATGQTANLTHGDLTESQRFATTCGSTPSGSSGPITTTNGFDNGSGPYGNPWWSNDADANAGNTAHLGCTVISGGAQHSACTTFDSYFAALPIQQTNALTQSTSVTYQPGASASASGGFGLWPLSTTDVNGQTTAYTYDPLGRQTSLTLPGETSGLTTQTMTYTVWCSPDVAQSPCAEVDQTQRLNSTTVITYRAFYDGMGHLVETRSPGPGGKDVVQYSFFDPSQRLVFKSIPYFVTSYTGAPGSAAYSIPDSTVAGTSYSYDGLGRATSMTDALSEKTTQAYSVVCNAAGTSDTACYEQTMSVDPLSHQSGVLVDALGRINYEQRYTGNSTSNYALYATAKYKYDYLGDLVKIVQPDGATTTTFAYDLAGRKTGMTDPDRGSETYVYDANGNLTQSVDARGSAGTVYAGYDGINRPIWRNTTNSPTGAYDTYSYDSTANGNVGIGRLTGETFSGSGLSGSYAYVYDARGRQTSVTLTVGSTNYPISNISYNDADSVLSQTYPDGEVVQNTYGSDAGWLSSVTSTAGSTTNTLLSAAQYTGNGGAYGEMTAANLDGLSPSNVYAFSAGFDLLGRATDLKTTAVGSGSTMFEQTRSFDAAGNVTTADTTLPAGTDNQAFCYDEQNRLTAAASSGTVPCQSFTAGTLSAATYNQAFAYDNMGRLTSGPLGAYTYGSSAHVHAATAIGSSYTAAYDASGDMTCRAPSSSTTCSGTQTGAQLGFNNEGQLASWQNKPSSPTTTGAFLYDGQGNRVAQQVTSGGLTTTTVYAGNVEEDSTTSGTTAKTTYYYANGSRIAMAVNGAFYYLATDGLGSVNVSLNTTGSMVASQLYAPYGTLRYASGTMPGDRGFTGQIADATSGLDYYGARYYDPLAFQFASADRVLPGAGLDLWGLSRYAYVESNPLRWTDPSGNHFECGAGGEAACTAIDFSPERAWSSYYATPGTQQKTIRPTRHGVSLPLPSTTIASSATVRQCCDIGAAWSTFIADAGALAPSFPQLSSPLLPQEICACAMSGGRDLSGLKRLSKSQENQLKAAGKEYEPHTLKKGLGGDNVDIFRDPKTGDLYVGPKDGAGVGDPLNVRLTNGGQVIDVAPSVADPIDDPEFLGE